MKKSYFVLCPLEQIKIEQNAGISNPGKPEKISTVVQTIKGIEYVLITMEDFAKISEVHPGDLMHDLLLEFYSEFEKRIGVFPIQEIDVEVK